MERGISIKPKDIRQHNKINMLRCLTTQKSLVLKELAAQCDTSTVTLGKIASELLEAGVITAQNNPKNEVGRHGLIYSLNLKQGLFACFDLAARGSLRCKLFDLAANCVAALSQRVDESHEAALAILIDTVRATADCPVVGVGVSTSGIYERKQDVVHSILNSWYRGQRFFALFSGAFATQNIVIGQDVTFAALAEGRELIQDDSQSLYYLYIGDGVGGAIISGRAVLEGVDGIAGDIGQVYVDHRGAGMKLEDVVSIGALTRHTDETDERLQLLYRSIYNALWMLNPNYFVLSSSDATLEERICREISGYIEDIAPDEMPLTTQFCRRAIDDGALMGTLLELRENYLQTL